MEPILNLPQNQPKPDQSELTTKFFEDNGYVVLTDVVPKEECKKLTDYMFKLVEDKKTENDPQCPLSESIYGAPEYDELLQRLAGPLGKHIGKELLPTYTYARLYRPGEELKIHKDRPSCEFSATMTLGFKEGDAVWPIFFDENKRYKLELDIGELAMYDGCNVAHWRPPFKGEWQVQLFLHYVDANGPYKEQYADGRKEFGKPKTPDNMREGWVDAEHKNGLESASGQTPQQIHWQRPVYGGVMFQSMDQSFPGFFPICKQNLDQLMFTKEECQKIIDIASKNYADDAGIGGGDGMGTVNKEIRDADLYGIHHTQENGWIFDKVSNIVSAVNTNHFGYDINGITHSLQLLHYKHKPEEDTDGHYNWHIDSGPGSSATRKISLSVQLSEPEDYEGGQLEVFDHGGPVIAPKEQGAVLLFPSYMPHKVHPITKGERWALVIWVHGYRRFT